MISILIPIRNEANYISRCLQAISLQDYPSELIEILITDGMSSDGTRTIITDWMKRDPRVRLFDNPRVIVPTGMNILIPQAKGEILIRVDGHCVIAPDYASNCVRHLQQDGVDGVGGPMRSIGEDLISQVIALAMSSKFGVGNSSFRTETGQTKLADTVPFPAYTREIIQKVGLYDEELVRNQDDEYNYRIREAGGKIFLADDVRSDYYSRGSFQKLWKQYFQYGYWKVRVLQKHPKQMSLRQFVPLSFVLALLLTLILTVTTSWGWISLIGLVCMYLFANLTASILTVSGQNTKKLLLLPIAFTIIHFSYGLGFLVGLFKFWNRWKDKAGKVPSIKYSS
jgi:glycosyltransferase involved in cell wall biosynthesis